VPYATKPELADYIYADPDHELPDSAARFLRTASNLVDNAIRGAVYDTDAQQNPTDPAVATALREAVCEQAQAWIIHSLDPAKGVSQLPPLKTSKSALGVSVSYDHGSARVEQEKLAAGEDIVAAAWHILNNAGLISAAVNSSRKAGGYPSWPIAEYDITTGQVTAS
jgi:hypothetical protein